MSAPQTSLPAFPQSLYGLVGDRVLRRPRFGVGYLLFSIMHAVGHAAMAVLAGALAQVLVGGGGLSAPRSMDRVHVLPGAADALSLALAGLAAVLLKVVGGIGASYVQGSLAGEVGSLLRARLLDALLGRNVLHRARQRDHGDEVGEDARAIAEITFRVRDVEGGFAAMLGAVRATAQLVAIAVVLALLAPKLASFALLALAPFALVQQIARRRYKRESARLAAKGDALFEAADEAVRHADLWRTYGAEGRIRAHVARLGEVLGRRGARLEAIAAALSGANELLGALALVLVVFVSRLGGVAPSEPLLPFAVAFFLAYRPLRELGEARLALTRASAAFGDLAPTLRAADDRPPKEGAPLPAWPLDTLAIDGLTLARGGLPSLDLEILPGEIVALVAPTGAGKTTLLRTLLGLEPPRAGAVRYGDRSLGGAGAGPRDRPFAWVPQDAPLLADTLAENVRLGAGAVDLDAVLAPLGASRLVGELGASRLGAGGRALSGGEKQWVALARALATELPVLLLDEPTSGLDAVSQRRVLDAVSRLRGKRTVILVTHREEPLGIADRVVRLAVGAPRPSLRDVSAA